MLWRACQLAGKGEIAVGFVGDGGTSEGDFHVALNMAGALALPLVVVCQNNQWAISVPLERQTLVTRLADKAKAYGMPGIRFGYGIAAENVIDTLQTVRQPWSINGLAGLATLAAFKDKEFIENTKRTITKEKSEFAKMLTEIGGLQVFPSETNFLLVKILKPKFTSTALREELAKKGLLIRDCSTFVGLDDSYLRVTVRSAENNAHLVDTLKKILSKTN